MLNLKITNPKLEREFHNILNFFNGNLEDALQDMINLEKQNIQAKPKQDWKKDFLSVSVWDEANENNITEENKLFGIWKDHETVENVYGFIREQRN
ncbi:hypothetical protein H8E88_32215 [candidate division KSB1 bacterium]|nr:hypothetical protein [candidate division KSB1 bacterium]